MSDVLIYVLGLLMAAVSMIGLLAFVTVWAVERVLDLTKLTGVITAWYIDKAREERDAKRIPG